MSTPHRTPSPTPPASNRFPYGWRFVKRRRPDGTEALDQVPLTLEDVLHPREGDVIPENTYHQRERDHLADVARIRRDRLVDGEVLSDCIINWNVRGLRNHSPDISVFEGVRGLPLPNLGTYRVARHGGRCRLAVEIVSPHTRTNDIDIKPDHYYRAGVEQYVIVDQRRLDGPREIISRRRTPDGFVLEPPDAAARVRLDALGLTLELRDNRLVIRDVDTCEELREYHEVDAAMRAARREAERATTALTRAERRAQRETTRREQVERRVQELEEELRRLRGEPPTTE